MQASITGETLGGDETFYVIQKVTPCGKSLKAYGNGAKYTAIVEANKEVIKDADKIFPGQKIRLPKVYNSIKSAVILDRTFFFIKIVDKLCNFSGFSIEFSGFYRLFDFLSL